MPVDVEDNEISDIFLFSLSFGSDKVMLTLNTRIRNVKAETFVTHRSCSFQTESCCDRGLGGREARRDGSFFKLLA